MQIKTFLAGLIGAASFHAVAADQLASGACTGVINVYDAVYDSPYYYAPDEDEDLAFNLATEKVCPGSYIQIKAVTSDGQMIQCENLVADAQIQLVQCPDTPKGTLPWGELKLVATWVEGDAVTSFSITHVQVTSTIGDIVTSTITSTLLDTKSVTSTTTNTLTFTAAQVTVTKPSVTVTNRVTVTPPATTATTTKVNTFSIVKKALTTTVTTKTSSLPCPTKLAPRVVLRCPPKKPRWFGMMVRSEEVDNAAALEARRLQRREENSGDGAAPDGPLTTTVTPDPEYITASVTSTTTLVITTTATPAVSTTVPNPTPTFTIYSGKAATTITTTLPQSTRWYTKYGFTIVSTTVTQTFTHTKTLITKPTCN